MCHHRTSDWYTERTRAEDETESEPDSPDYAAEMTGREVDEPEVADPEFEFEESEVDTPELEDDEAGRPAATPSDD
ncbi:hypothetical protein BRD04_10540 [Halobacteriales archaeon QS_9_67_17]|nr:MAG: hypothetical protein BRD04_10540 [Halobacteriales archaeon QS_9_67_17]